MALAPHVARMLLRGEGERVRCTLDGGLQIFALEALDQQLGQLRDRNVSDGAVLVVDNATGDILAYAANQGRASSAPHVDGIRALRQAGSTLKPFLYGLAIEKEFLTAASILEDSPLQIPTAGGLYIPENYDREFLGPVSLRTALSSSLNIPAVRTLMLVTPDSFVERLRALGMTSLEHEADYYGFSLALGSADVTLYELVNAYRTLANRGRWGKLRLAASRGPGGACTRHGRAGGLHRLGHPLGPRGPECDLRAGEPAGHPLLDGREDGHEQRHARQLVRRATRSATPSASGWETSPASPCGTSREWRALHRSGSTS